MKIWQIAVAILALAVIVAPASASVWTCDQTGAPKSVFYTNETVYATSANITSGEQNVRVYKVMNNNSWVDGMNLTDVATYTSASTNSSGHLPVTLVWQSPSIGNYDIVADTDMDGVYNSSTDFLNSSSTAGFSVAQALIPTLTISAGESTPSDHEWTSNNTGHNPMLQISASASIEPIVIKSLALTADGTGDDKDGVVAIYAILDQNGNGEYDQGEMFLAYSEYMFNDGVAMLNINNGFKVEKDQSADILFTYMMGNVGGTYRLDIVSISATGFDSGEEATVFGLPIGSATTTVEWYENATVEEPVIVENETLSEECETDSDCGGMSCNNLQLVSESCEYDENLGMKVCISNIANVDCCGDDDCSDGYYCSGYTCYYDDASSGGYVETSNGSENYPIIIASIVIVSVLAVVLFLIMKNRKKNPWKSGSDYSKDRDWDSLKRKWGRKY